MTTWVLILTFLGAGQTTAPAVTMVPGFAAQAACVKAGNAWLMTVDLMKSRHQPDTNPSFVCVNPAGGAPYIGLPKR